MIEKTISIICDACKCAIDHFTGYTKKRAAEVTKQEGTIFYKGMHFCGEGCRDLYLVRKSNGPLPPDVEERR